VTAILAVHPTGIGVTAALFCSGELRAVTCAEAPGMVLRADRGGRMAGLVTSWLLQYQRPDCVVVEFPRSYVQQTISVQTDMALAAFMLGCVTQAVGVSRVVFVAPWAWRRELSDLATRDLVTGLLGPGEIEAYRNATQRTPGAVHFELLAAIGVGLYFGGRIKA